MSGVSKEMLDGLDVGAVLETPPLCPKLNDRKLVWSLSSKSPNGKVPTYKFSLFWMEVPVGEVIAEFKKGTLNWRMSHE